MKLTEQIDQIIDRRIGRNGYEGKGHLQVIKRQKSFFDEIGRLVDDYSTLRTTILSQVQEQKGEYYLLSSEDPAFYDNVVMADPSAFILQLQKCQKECERLEKRFNRDMINISVVGRARQGKSRLLQSISGLPNEIIPADDGGDCTGAKSVISNSHGPTHAEVIFYSEVEIVDAVNEYLTALGSNNPIGSVNQIPSIDTDKIEQSIISGTDKTSLLVHLKKYVNHYDSYAPLLGKTLQVSEPNEIRRYTSQYLTNNVKTYEYLGVKEVKIYTEFNYADAGKIQLVDTIGLFDTALGLEKKMMTTLADESDAAILLRLPNSMGDHVDEHDNKLYNDIENALGSETLNMWLFYVLNVWSANAKSGTFMLEQLKEQHGKTLRSAFVKEVNCADREEVEREIVIPILETLSKNLEKIDRNLMASANKQFMIAYASYFELCNKARNVLKSAFTELMNTGGLFDDKFEELLLSDGLRELNIKYKNISGTACTQLLKEIEDVTGILPKLVPTVENLISQIAHGNRYSDYTTIYNQCSHLLRSRISDEFERVTNNTIIELQENLKDEIIHVLRDENAGKLGLVPLMSVGVDSPNKEWLEALISEKMDNYPLVKQAFQLILDYRISIEGAIENKINQCLAIFDPNSQQSLRINWGAITTDKAAAKFIQQHFYNSVSIFSNSLIESLSELLTIPYTSFATRISKLRDKIIFSENGRKELKNLYRDNCGIIWREEFSNQLKKQTANNAWNKYCEQLSANCQKEKFMC